MNTEDVKKLAVLARITISDAQAEKMSAEMDAIVGYVNKIQSADLQAASFADYTDRHNIFRNDTAIQEATDGTSEDLLKNAPATENHFIKVPRILKKRNNE